MQPARTVTVQALQARQQRRRGQCAPQRRVPAGRKRAARRRPGLPWLRPCRPARRGRRPGRCRARRRCCPAHVPGPTGPDAVFAATGGVAVAGGGVALGPRRRRAVRGGHGRARVLRLARIASWQRDGLRQGQHCVQQRGRRAAGVGGHRSGRRRQAQHHRLARPGAVLCSAFPSQACLRLCSWRG